MRQFADEVVTRHGVELRSMNEADIPAITAACQDPELRRWIPVPQPYTEDTAREFALDFATAELSTGRGIQRAITIDGEFVGVIGLMGTDWQVGSTEAGYWLAPWGRGRGAMTRALAALTDWALDSQGIRRVQVQVASGNVTSLATARRAGFLREGVRRRAGQTHSGPVDLVVFSRLADDPRPTF